MVPSQVRSLKHSLCDGGSLVELSGKNLEGHLQKYHSYLQVPRGDTFCLNPVHSMVWPYPCLVRVKVPVSSGSTMETAQTSPALASFPGLFCH